MAMCLLFRPAFGGWHFETISDFIVSRYGCTEGANTEHTYCPVFRWIWYPGVRYSDGYCTFKNHQVTFVCQGLWVEVLHFWRKIWPWQLLLRSLPDLQPDIRFLPVAPWSWCNAWGTLQTPPPKSCQRPVIQMFKFLGLTLDQASPKSRNEFAKMVKTKMPNKI